MGESWAGFGWNGDAFKTLMTVMVPSYCLLSYVRAIDKCTVSENGLCNRGK